MQSSRSAIVSAFVALAAAGQPACAGSSTANEPVVAVPGTTVTFKPYAEVEGGYDSNPDNLVHHKGSAFEKLEAGVVASQTTTDAFYLLALKARDVHFETLDRSQRWDFKAEAEAAFQLSDTSKLKIDGSYLHDSFSLDRADIYKARADYTYKEADYRVRLQAKSHVEKNIGGDERGALDIDVFNATRSSAFDHWRADGQIALLGFTRGWLQPFAIYDYANIDYFSQAADPSIDRNAREQFGIAGLRVQPSKDFRIDLGARLNHREFDEPTLRRFTSTFFDANLFWQPIDELKITAVIERFLRETTTAFGLADDVKSYGMTVDWRVQTAWFIKGSVYYDEIKPIGDDFKFRKVTTSLSVTYRPSDRLELFASGLTRWSHEEFSGDGYDRYKIGGGVRFKF